MKRLCVYFVCLSLLGGCGSRGGKAGAGDGDVVGESGLMPPYRVELEQAIGNPVAVGLSEIVGEITYLPLETTGNSLLKERLIVTMTDSLIFVSDNAWQLMMFDRQGKFLRRIGRIGNGPGEYHTILDYALSPDGQRVSFLDQNRGIFEYDLGGKFFKNYAVPQELNGASGDFMVMDDGSFLFGCGNITSGHHPTEAMAFMMGRDGSLKKMFKTSRKRATGMFFLLCSLYSFDGDVRFREALSDTLYTLTPDLLTPHAIFDFGAGGVDPERLLSNSFTDLHGFILRRVNESARGLYFDMEDIAKRITRYGYFDKRNGEAKVFDVDGFVNDLDGGVPFVPKYVSGDDVLVGWVDAYALKEYVEALDAEEMTRLYGERFARLAGLEEDDNPVLVMVK